MKRFLCLLILLFIMCPAETRAMAAETENTGDMRGQPGEFSVWRDGVSANVARRGGVTEAALSAPESARGYFYPYLYMHGEYDLTGYSAYSYRIRNVGQTPLKINFVLTDLDGTDYRTGDSDSVVVIRNGASTPERIFPGFGLFELEPGFDGEIHVPVGRVPKTSLQGVVSYGVTVAVPAASAVSFEISDIKWLTKPMYVPEFRLSGPAELQIPVMGEAAARYTVEFEGNTARRGVVFMLEDGPEDVSVTEDGILAVGKKAKAGPVRLGVSVDGLVNGSISLTLLEKRSDFAFPEPDRYPAKTGPFFSEAVLNGARIAVVVIAAYLSGLYLLWKTAEQGNGE